MTKYLKTHYILNDSIGCNQARGFPLQTTENKSDVTCKYCIKEHKIEQKLSVRKFTRHEQELNIKINRLKKINLELRRQLRGLKSPLPCETNKTLDIGEP